MSTTTVKATGIYEQLKARCWPFIEAFEDDLLVHDRDMLAEHPGRQFLHWTRRCGTHLMILNETEDLPGPGQCVPYLFGTANREHIVRGFSRFAESCAESCVLCLYYDGQRLREVTTEQAVEIARKHVSRLRREWEVM